MNLDEYVMSVAQARSIGDANTLTAIDSDTLHRAAAMLEGAGAADDNPQPLNDADRARTMRRELSRRANPWTPPWRRNG